MNKHPAIFLCNMLSEETLYQMRDEVLQVRKDLIEEAPPEAANLLRDCEMNIAAINTVLNYRDEQRQWAQAASVTQRILRKIFR